MTELSRYHVTFEDPASGEVLGLMLVENAGALGFSKRLSNPYAAKTGAGDRTLHDLTDFSVYGQTGWEGGRGQDIFEEDVRYYDAQGIETRIKGQLTLGPLSVATGVGTVPEYEPESYTGRGIGTLWLSQQERAMQFTCPAGGLTCTHVTLMIRRNGTPSGQQITVRIETNSGGLPSGTLVHANATKTIDVADLPSELAEYKVVFPASFSLTAATDYHIVINWTGKLCTTGYALWASDTTASYASGDAAYKPRKWTVGASIIGGADKIDSASWTADSSLDFWFRINDGMELAGAVTVNPVRYNGVLYAAAYDTVYSWGGSSWTSEDVQAAEVITDMCVWGGKLWVARGTNTMRTLTGAVWADDASLGTAQKLFQYQGYLYATDPTNTEYLYYTSDGSTWSSAIVVGPGDWGIQGIAGFRDEIALSNDVGLWLLAYEWAYQVLDWRSLEASTNGAAMLAWSRTNELFIPVGFGLYRWTGSTMVACGPDKDTGLPADRAGKIAALCGTVNWLFAAIDAGASGYSSILAYGGQGWHEIARAGTAGDRIRALAYETISSPPRLWYGEADTLRYVEMPDYTDNPYAYTGVAVTGAGEITLSSWGSELMTLVKDFRAVIVQSENTSSTQTIDVYYEINRSGVWRLLDTIDDASLIHTLEFAPSDFDAQTILSSSTVTTIEVPTLDIEAGDWVRINDEIRQVESVTDSDTLVLVEPLSEAPSAGDICYAAYPAGTELRLRLNLATSDNSESPKVLAIAVLADANLADRWLFGLDVDMSQGMECLNGSPYPMGVPALETELDKWIQRKTPFTLYTPRGTSYTVKVANAAEQQYRRGADESPTYSSVMRLTLTEVEVT